jgi:hypothetical protein
VIEIGQVYSTSYTRIEIIGVTPDKVTYITKGGVKETVSRSTFEGVVNGLIMTPYAWKLVKGTLHDPYPQVLKESQ